MRKVGILELQQVIGSTETSKADTGQMLDHKITNNKLGLPFSALPFTETSLQENGPVCFYLVMYPSPKEAEMAHGKKQKEQINKSTELSF